MSIPEKIQTQFDYLLEQVKLGNVLLVETTFKATGKPAYALVVAEEAPYGVDMYPIGLMARDEEAFELLNPPEYAREGVMNPQGKAVFPAHASEVGRLLSGLPE